MLIKKLMNHILCKRAEKLFLRIETHLPETGTVLDIGSGTGHNAEVIRQGTELEITEADVANLKTTPPSPVIFDGHSLPFEENFFRSSLLLFVLHYSDDPAGLLREAKRVSSGNLIVIQSTYSGSMARSILKTRDWFQGILAFYIARLVGLVGNCPCPLYPKTFMDREVLNKIFSESGWKVKELEPCLWPLVKISRDLYVLERV